MDDDELIRRAVETDDLDAFGGLVLRHQSRVRGFLRRLCRGDTHRADDLAQETFLTAHRRLVFFDRRRRFESWLLGIAYNTFRNDRRSGWREDPGIDSGTERAGPSLAGEIAARVDLENAMAALRPEEVAALTLCYQDGHSHDEAARLLGVPLGTLKSWVQRGRQRLGMLLEEKLPS